MAITAAGNNQQNDLTYFECSPKEVICEFTKHINKVSDIRNLSLVSQHFFQTIFGNK
ncbi:MAG: hypothetical protein JSR93_02030, partial [Verrucomicrobia bacterium]|nr:hypothetical protein [Verrucomicrobiota bacterium]